MKRKKLIKSITLFGALVCSFFISYSQKTITEFLDELNKATSHKAKADACFAISRKYADGLKIDSALYFAQRIKEFSQNDNYETGIGKYHLALSIAYYFRGRNDEAKENVEEAIRILTNQKEYSFLGIAYWQLGTVQESQYSSEASRKNYWASIHFLAAAKDTHNLFRTYFWMARSYEKTSDYDSSAHYSFEALTLAENSLDSFKIHTVAIQLGEIFLNLRNVAKAYQYLDYALKYRTRSVNKVMVWITLGNYAICLSRMRQYERADSAIAVFEKSARQFNDEWGWITLNKLKGMNEYEKENYPDAVKYLSEAFQEAHRIVKNKTDIKQIALGLGKAEFKIENYQSAISHLRYAAQLSRQLKLMLDEMEADALISQSFQKINMPDSALFYFRNYSLLKDSVLSIEKQKMVMEVTTRYETEKKEQAIRMLQKESEANSYLLRLTSKEIEANELENERKSQQLELAVKQNEINKLDISQKSLHLDNEKKENEKNQAKLKLMERETAYQKLVALKQNQQKNIVLISIAITLALSGIGIYRYIRRKKLQNQQQVLKERLRISRELHDEVGSTLSGIAMYGHLTKEQIKASKPEEVERSLNNILQSAGEMMNKLSDIVWLVNPEKDSFQKLIERLEEFAINIARTKNIEMKINLPDKLDGMNIPVETRRDIYLFCKEAINNAVKYSDAKMIELTMRETENRKIEILVADDGRGFNAVTVKKGNGLMNMRQRAEQVNGIFSLLSSPGEGTKISLSFKIT